MLGPQELGDPLIGRIVDQDGAQQRLLGLEIVRRLAQQGIFGAGQPRDVVGFFEWLHGRAFLFVEGAPLPSQMALASAITGTIHGNGGTDSRRIYSAAIERVATAPLSASTR